VAITANAYGRHSSDSGPVLGGYCTWDPGSRTERIRPFREIRCLLSLYVRRHRFAVRVLALVDPDPRFITR
jgi:hypothetical protein